MQPFRIQFADRCHSFVNVYHRQQNKSLLSLNKRKRAAKSFKPSFCDQLDKYASAKHVWEIIAGLVAFLSCWTVTWVDLGLRLRNSDNWAGFGHWGHHLKPMVFLALLVGIIPCLRTGTASW